MNEIFVQPFNNKERRQYLTDRFRAFLEKFIELGLSAEIWIDGSYSTLEPEPKDIDIVIFYDPIQLNSLKDDKRLLVSELFDNNVSKIRYNCDLYIAPITDANLRSYWRGWYGYSRNEKPKGILRLNYAFN